jgi:hypothetical protein
MGTWCLGKNALSTSAARDGWLTRDRKRFQRALFVLPNLPTLGTHLGMEMMCVRFQRRRPARAPVAEQWISSMPRSNNASLESASNSHCAHPWCQKPSRRPWRGSVAKPCVPFRQAPRRPGRTLLLPSRGDSFSGSPLSMLASSRCPPTPLCHTRTQRNTGNQGWCCPTARARC